MKSNKITVIETIDQEVETQEVKKAEPGAGPEIKKTIPFYASQLDIFGEEQRVKCNYSQMSLF
jgi:hypothetical protein